VHSPDAAAATSLQVCLVGQFPDVTRGDRVYLLARIGDHPAGTTGVVVEAHPDGTYGVEVGSGERLLVAATALAPETDTVAQRRRT
jgi:hypothetical protein